MKHHPIVLSVLLASLCSFAIGNDFGDATSPTANLTFTKSGKLFADSTEIPRVAPDPPVRRTAELLINYLEDRHAKSPINTIHLVRETGTKASFDADTMIGLVKFAQSNGIQIEGPSQFEDRVLGFRRSH